MKKQQSGSSLFIFSIIGTLAALFSCILIVMLSLQTTISIDEYPLYSYSQYIDRSQSQIFTADGGAQLYEAESFNLSGSAKIKENIYASGENEVANLYTGASLKINLSSTSDITCKLMISTSFISANGKPIASSNLFQITLNQEDITPNVNIEASYNEYDFIESTLTLVNLTKGINTFILTSLSNSYAIDYFVLVSPNNVTSSDQPIGNYQNKFIGSESRQEFYASLQSEIIGAVIIEEEIPCTVFFSNPDESIAFYVNSDEEITTIFSINAKKKDSSYNTPGLSITVNNQSVDTKAAEKMTAQYSVIEFGYVDLNPGENKIVIKNLGGYFLLKSIFLNSDIVLSPTKSNQRFEAENASLNGKCHSAYSDSGSGKYVVGYNLANSFVDFKLKSNYPLSNHLSIRLSYVGAKLPLSQIIKITVNSQAYTIKSDKEIEPTDYDNYLDLYIGEVHLNSGDNSLIITSINGNYNLDCISFFNSEIKSGELFNIESENLILQDSAVSYYSSYASGKYYVTGTGTYASVTLFFYSDKETLLTLGMSLSYPSPFPFTTADLFTVMINSENIAYNEPSLSGTASLTTFQEATVGNFAFTKGMNVLRINFTGASFGLDCLSLLA
ncbi:MAG: hypothetical protein WCR67_02870 [Bacilli bacterium]